MGFKITNIKRNVNALMFLGKKHSPIILTSAGMAGMVGTAVLSYKAAKKVTEITEDIEAMNANGTPMDKKYQMLRIGQAVLPPVVLGTTSLICIFGSYHVLNKRNGVLASALSYLTSENKRYKETLRSNKLLEKVVPAHDVIEEEDADGNKVHVVDTVNIPQLDAAWYDESEYYVSDDHDYNMRAIHAAEQRILDRQCTDGAILLNDVLYELGIAPKKIGAQFGWSGSELITLDQTVLQQRDGEGNMKPVIMVQWPMPSYIYDKVDYSGHSVF